MIFWLSIEEHHTSKSFVDLMFLVASSLRLNHGVVDCKLVSKHTYLPDSDALAQTNKSENISSKSDSSKQYLH